MKNQIRLMCALSIALLVPAAWAGFELTREQKKEFALLCKTRLEVVPKVDWDDYCDCATETLENEFSRADYVTFKEAMLRRAPPPAFYAKKILPKCQGYTTPAR